MPRRANDPDLLRAQAQSGREGANAYKAAQQQLIGQRQAAVQQAMQEAALRGAPGAAVAQVGNQIRRPYNQAIRSNTQMAAGYGADMAARQGRMYDYNQAVLAARQLIPTQIQAAVAPIRAENRYRLQSLRQEGANRVSELEAETALRMAQMQAEERLREQESEGAGESLTEGELQAALIAGARDRLDPAAETISAAVGAGRKQARGAYRAELGPARSEAQTAALQLADAGMYGTPGANLFEQRAAMLGGPDTPPLTAAVGGPATPSGPSAFNYGVVPGSDPFAEQRNAMLGEAPPPAGSSLRPRPSLGGGAGGPASFDINAFRGLLGDMPGVADTDRLRAGANEAAAALAKIQKRGVQPLSQYGMLSEEQVAGLPDYEQGLVEGAPEPFNSQFSIRKLLFGEPSAIDETGEATVSPYAADVKQEAMRLAAADLVGTGQYDINMPGIENAILGTPETMYDIEQAQAGQPTTQARVAASQAKDAADEAGKQDKAAVQRAGFRSTFHQVYGVAMPGEQDDTEDIAQLALSQETGPVFKAIYDEFVKIINADPQVDVEDAITDAIANFGGLPENVNEFGVRQLLKDLKS